MNEDAIQDRREEDGEITLGSPLAHDPDAPRVGPTFAGPFAIGGGIAGVNDPGAERVDVRITRYEAEVLFRHWFERKREVDEFCIIYQQSGSSDWRESAYSSYRLDAFEPHVSPPFLAEIRKEVERRDAATRAARDEYLGPEGDDGGIEELARRLKDDPDLQR